MNGEFSRDLSATYESTASHKQFNNDDQSEPKCWKQYGYIFTYSLMLMTLGCLETFSSALFVELEKQLNVETVVVALILTIKSIAFGISSFLSAYILDYFTNTHYAVSFITLSSTIAITIIPFVTNVSIMYIIFIFVGTAIGILFVSFPVYIFHAYPSQQTKMMYVVMTIYGISKTILPLLVQLSITLTSSYQYSLNLIACVSSLTCVLLCILPTPKHDHLRSLKQDLVSRKESEDLRRMKEALKSDKAHRMKERILIIILAFIMATFSATQSGLVNYITSYCADYLDIDEAIGRYMISSYYGGQLLYRLLVAVCVSNKLKKIWLPQRVITFGFIMMDILLVLFVVFDDSAAIIFFVYFGIGFVSSGIFPDIFKWCELLTPVSGVLSCVFIAGFSIGDALIVFGIGELVNIYGIQILQWPLLAASSIGSMFIVCNIVLYSNYAKQKRRILSGLEVIGRS